MNDNVQSDTPAAPESGGAQLALLQAAHTKELAALREINAQLMAQQALLKLQRTQEQTSHTLWLREANEHLVLATFSAQDKQASAEERMQRQTNFLSMLAHELRNPLQPIAYANALLGKLAGSSPEMPRLNAIIERQMGHMTRLIDDLLDASRISSGKMGLYKSTLALADIIALAAESSQPLIDARQQQLTMTLPPYSILVHGDRMRLAQVVSNLLNNASKFSPESGSITLTAQVVDGMAQIAVRDQGIGIAADLQPFIFDLFTQGKQSLERAQGGLGIGLTLVRSLVDMHGGTVQVRSEGAGTGSTFTVRLPLSAEVLAMPAVASRRRACPARGRCGFCWWRTTSTPPTCSVCCWSWTDTRWCHATMGPTRCNWRWRSTTTWSSATLACPAWTASPWSSASVPACKARCRFSSRPPATTCRRTARAPSAAASIAISSSRSELTCFWN